MRIESLILLDDPAARRLLVTWNDVPSKHRRETEVLADWARLSGLEYTDVARVAPTLFAAEICARRGKADQAALTYVTAGLRAVLAAMQQAPKGEAK